MNKFEKVKFMKYFCVVIIFIITIFFMIWQYSLTQTQEIDITADIIQMSENMSKTEYVEGGKILIKCYLETSKIETINGRNYVLGSFEGNKLNCSVVIKDGNNYQKLKTVYGKYHYIDDIDDLVYTFEACIKTDIEKDDLEIYLLDNEKNLMYQYVGEKNEEEI